MSARRTATVRRIVLGLVLAALLALVLATVACAPSKADVAAEHKATCLENQKQLKMAIDLVHADSGVYADLASVEKQLPDAKCPDGGTYTFDPNTDTMSCSIHGSAAPSTP